MPPSGAVWNGWGVNTSNTRFQDAATAGLAAADVPRLKLKWAFGFPGDLQSNAQATLAGGRVFVGSAGGQGLFARAPPPAASTGSSIPAASMRAAISIGRIDTRAGARYAAFFGDGAGHGLRARRGDRRSCCGRRRSTIFRSRGSPARRRCIAAVSTCRSRPVKKARGASPSYRVLQVSRQRCRARRGDRQADLEELHDPRGGRFRPRRTKSGTQLWGPSGAPVWSSPAIDEKRNVLYITTGNNYSDPPSRMSDSFVAMDLKSGKILWSKQMTPSDAYTSACRLPDKTNCAGVERTGLRFQRLADPGHAAERQARAGGRPEIRHRPRARSRSAGRDAVADPRRQGGTMGGVQWGSATDGTNVYVANSDIGRIMLNFSTFTDADPNRGGGMFALRLETGERVWYTPPVGCDGRKRCSPAQSAAVSAMPGVAFSGSVDGHMRAYSAADGRVLWDFDTIRPYETVNRVPARGGSLDGPGPAIGGGMIFFNSGYHTAGGVPGNVLLAFSVDGK